MRETKVATTITIIHFKMEGLCYILYKNTSKQHQFTTELFVMDYFSWWRVCSVRTLRTALPEGARSAKQLRKSCASCRAKYEKKAKYRTMSGERPWKAETPKSADHIQITEKESAGRLSILNEYHNQGFPIMYCDVIPVLIRRLPNMLFTCWTFCSYGTLWNTPCWCVLNQDYIS